MSIFTTQSIKPKKQLAEKNQPSLKSEASTNVRSLSNLKKDNFEPFSSSLASLLNCSKRNISKQLALAFDNYDETKKTITCNFTGRNQQEIKLTLTLNDNVDFTNISTIGKKTQIVKSVELICPNSPITKSITFADSGRTTIACNSSNITKENLSQKDFKELRKFLTEKEPIASRVLVKLLESKDIISNDDFFNYIVENRPYLKNCKDNCSQKTKENIINAIKTGKRQDRTFLRLVGQVCQDYERDKNTSRIDITEFALSKDNLNRLKSFNKLFTSNDKQFAKTFYKIFGTLEDPRFIRGFCQELKNFSTINGKLTTMKPDSLSIDDRELLRSLYKEIAATETLTDASIRATILNRHLHTLNIALQTNNTDLLSNLKTAANENNQNITDDIAQKLMKLQNQQFKELKAYFLDSFKANRIIDFNKLDINDDGIITISDYHGITLIDKDGRSVSVKTDHLPAQKAKQKQIKLKKEMEKILQEKDPNKKNSLIYNFIKEHSEFAPAFKNIKELQGFNILGYKKLSNVTFENCTFKNSHMVIKGENINFKNCTFEDSSICFKGRNINFSNITCKEKAGFELKGKFKNSTVIIKDGADKFRSTQTKPQPTILSSNFTLDPTCMTKKMKLHYKKTLNIQSKDLPKYTAEDLVRLGVSPHNIASYFNSAARNSEFFKKLKKDYITHLSGLACRKPKSGFRRLSNALKGAGTPISIKKTKRFTETMLNTQYTSLKDNGNITAKDNNKFKDRLTKRYLIKNGRLYRYRIFKFNRWDINAIDRIG